MGLEVSHAGQDALFAQDRSRGRRGVAGSWTMLRPLRGVLRVPLAVRVGLPLGWLESREESVARLHGRHAGRPDGYIPSREQKAWIAVGLAIAFSAALILLPSGFMLIRALSKGQRKAFLQAVGEGRAFGSGRQDQACLDEAVRRAAGIKDVLGSVRNQAFLNGCLAVASPTQTFCADVPAEGSVLGRTKWALSRVRAAGLDARNPFQRGLFDDVFRQCQKRRQGTKGAAK